MRFGGVVVVQDDVVLVVVFAVVVVVAVLGTSLPSMALSFASRASRLSLLIGRQMHQIGSNTMLLLCDASTLSCLYNINKNYMCQ
jgi:hypothetical protein